MRTSIMNLGKCIVKELNLDPGVDTLGRWMAHYIAEQMECAKNAVDNSKVETEQKCFETILKLWGHRSSMPNGKRPFENFEPIFNVLENLDPENKRPFFYRINPDSLEPEDINLNEEKLSHFLDLAEGIDRVVRIWLENIFEQAARCANDEQTKVWLENSIVSKGGHEASVISSLLPGSIFGEEKNHNERRRDSLNYRIKQLEAFDEFNKNLLAIYNKELEDLD